MNFKNKKIAYKIRNSLLVLLIAVLSVGFWLPNYLVLEKGININITSDRLYNCLTHPENWQKWGAKWKIEPATFAIGELINLPQLDINQTVRIEDIVDEEYLNFQGDSISLALQLENEDRNVWLALTYEEDLGKNPFNKLFHHLFHSQLVTQLENSLYQIKKTCSTKK